jgi:membrane-bound lytic murein transglycosylase B
MKKTSLFVFGLVFVSAVFMLPIFFSLENQVSAQLSSVEQEREELESQLKELEDQIAGIEGDITKTQAEKDTLNNQIYVLRSKIKKLNLQINQSNILIGDLRSQIQDTSASIEKTTEEVETAKSQIGVVLQRVYQEDRKTKVEIVLAGETLSDFFQNVASLGALNANLRQLLANMEELNDSLNSQKGALESEKGEEENFVKIQLLQKQENQGLQQQTETLLVETKGKEAEYQRLLKDKQAQANEIRSRIFELIGVSDAPTFGEAVEIANGVSAQVGVRPALLLAVLTQESNLGKNVGQCYLQNTKTGSGVSTKGTVFKNVMKPTRDVKPFLRITKALGREPLETPVSCPIPSVGGYGGAMGPAQFIPSTWAIFEDRLAAIKGSSADPWNIKDAFLATGLYLGDLGATKKTYDHEWCAALSYFSGNCSIRNQVRYEFYGDSVMALAARYDRDIQTLKDAS